MGSTLYVWRHNNLLPPTTYSVKRGLFGRQYLLVDSIKYEHMIESERISAGLPTVHLFHRVIVNVILASAAGYPDGMAGSLALRLGLNNLVNLSLRVV